MQKFTLIQFVALLLFSLSMFSCNEYEKVLKSKDMELKARKADEYYEKGKYNQANTLYQEVLQNDRTNPNYEETYFRYAKTFYELGNYWDASLYFNTFATSFPNNDKKEEALYLAAKSFSNNSPRYVLDQRDTRRAIDAFKSYKLNFPNSERIPDVDSTIAQLERKLEKKDYEAARLYLKIQQYKAAAVSFDELIKKYPNSPYIEKYKSQSIESLVKYADKSKESKQPERYRDALEQIKYFIYNYKDSEYLPKVKSIQKEVESKLNSIQS